MCLNLRVLGPMPTRRGAPLTVCGKPLSPGDRKVWQQAIALLMGLKVRNDIGEKDLAGAVETALVAEPTANKKPTVNATRKCEDCGVKVASRAAGHAASRGGRAVASASWRLLNPAAPPNLHSISCKAST